jgi:hypothetical protein
MRKPHQAGYPMAVDDMAKLAAELSESGYREINNPAAPTVRRLEEEVSS